MFTCSILFAGYMNLYRKLKRKQMHTIPSSRVVVTADVMSHVCNTLLTKLGTGYAMPAFSQCRSNQRYFCDT